MDLKDLYLTSPHVLQVTTPIGTELISSTFLNNLKKENEELKIKVESLSRDKLLCDVENLNKRINELEAKFNQLINK